MTQHTDTDPATLADEIYEEISVSIDEACRNQDQVRLLAIQCDLLLSIVRRLNRIERVWGRPRVYVEGTER